MKLPWWRKKKKDSYMYGPASWDSQVGGEILAIEAPVFLG